MGMSIGSSSSSLALQSSSVSSAWQQRHQNMNALKTALQNGDLSGAQSAFSAITANNPNINPNGPLAQIGAALQTGNISAAQQVASSFEASRGSAGAAGPGGYGEGSGQASGSTYGFASTFATALVNALTQAGIGTNSSSASNSSTGSTPGSAAAATTTTTSRNCAKCDRIHAKPLCSPAVPRPFCSSGCGYSGRYGWKQ